MPPLSRYGLTILLLATAGCAQPLGSPSSPASESTSDLDGMKGIELYSWLAGDGSRHYALLPGTNRLKTRGEVLAAQLQANQQDRLRTIFDDVPRGQTVVWQTLPGDTPAPPPRRLVEDLQALAKAQGFTLIFPTR